MNSGTRFFGRISRIVFLIGVLVFVNTSLIMAQSKEDAYRTEQFSVSGKVSLEVQTSGGSISVIGSNKKEVEVEMYVRKRGSYKKPEDVKLDDYSIEISQDGNEVKAIAKHKSNKGWNWGNGYSISFVVYTPQETRTRLNTSGGSLVAKNLTGSQELNTSGGSIMTEGIQGEMNLRTSGGSISMSDSRGNVEARTSGGTIKVDAVLGDLDVRTSGGSISLKGIEGNVDARTSGGSILAEVLAPADHIELRTSGGSISLKVPRNIGYDINLDGNRVHAELENFSGKKEKDEIRGTMNGGGTRIKAKTGGGSVRLGFQ